MQKKLLHTLNVCEIPAKVRHVVDDWVAGETSVSKILSSKYLEYVPLIIRNYKKLIITKIVIFTFSSFSSAQCFLVTAAQ